MNDSLLTDRGKDAGYLIKQLMRTNWNAVRYKAFEEEEVAELPKTSMKQKPREVFDYL